MCGSHTGAAYSRCGQTSDTYTELKEGAFISVLVVPIVKEAKNFSSFTANILNVV